MTKFHGYCIKTLLISILSYNVAFSQSIIPEFAPKIERKPRITAHILQPDGKIILGGFFTFSGDSKVSHVIRLNPDGSLDQSFNLDASIPYDQVFHIFLSKDDQIVILSNRNGMHVLTEDGTIDPSFSYPDNVFTNPFAAPVDDGYLIYSYEKNEQYHGIFKINLDGSVNSEFNPIRVINIDGIQITSDSDFLVHGSFTKVNDTDQAYLAKFDQSGNMYETFEPDFDGPVYDAIPLNDGSVLVGGSFTGLGDISNKYFVKLTEDGLLDESFSLTGYNQVFNTYPFEVFVDGNKFLVLSFQGTTQRSRLARFEANGQIDSSFEILEYEMDRNLISLSRFNDGYLMSGDLEFLYDSEELYGIVALKNDGMRSNQFDHGVRNVAKIEKSLVTQNSKYILSGDITGVDQQNSKQLVILDREGSLDVNFDNNLPLTFEDLISNVHELSTGQFLVSGLFYGTGLPEGTTKQLIKINPDGKLDESFNVKVEQTHSLSKIEDFVVLSDKSIVVVGAFYQINGTNIKSIAKISSIGELDLGFNSQGLFDDYNFTAVDTLEDGSLVAGGTYSDKDGRDFGVLSSLDDSGNPDESKFGVIEDFPIRAQHFELNDSNLIITGRQCCNEWSPVVIMNTLDWSVDDSSISLYRYGRTWSSLEINDSTVLLGGSFSLVNETESDALVAVSYNGVVNSNLVFTVEGFYFEGLSPAIHSISKISQDTVLISGIFTGINNENVYSVAKLRYRINNAPYLEIDTALILEEDSPLSLSDAWVTGVDQENDPVEIIFLEGENYSIVDENLIPDLNFNGTIFLNVRGFDGEKFSETETIRISITPINDAPEILDQVSPIDLKAGIENNINHNVFEISDPDDLQFTLEIISTGDDYVSDGRTITPNESVEGEINFQVIASDGKDLSHPFEAIANVSPVLGIKKNTVSIFPNPFEHHLKVNLKRESENRFNLEVRRLDGKLILSERISGESNIFLPDLKPGIYFLMIKGVFGREVHKIVKK